MASGGTQEQVEQEDFDEILIYIPLLYPSSRLNVKGALFGQRRLLTTWWRTVYEKMATWNSPTARWHG